MSDTTDLPRRRDAGQFAYVGVDEDGIVRGLVVDLDRAATSESVADFVYAGWSVHRVDIATAREKKTGEAF